MLPSGCAFYMAALPPTGCAVHCTDPHPPVASLFLHCDLRPSSVADLRRRVLEHAYHHPASFFEVRSTNSSVEHSRTHSGSGSAALRTPVFNNAVPRTPSMSVPGGPSVAATPSLNAHSFDVRSVSELVTLLLGHEIDRMVAWHNPNGVASKVLLHQSEFSFELTLAPRMDDAAWVRLVDVCWRTSPSVAVKMVRTMVSGRGCPLCLGSPVLSSP
jgi:hypothetical protein